MPLLADHCAECEQVLGKSFIDVHIWLDQYAFTPEYGMRHRRVRHHEVGIREAMKLFGDDAGEAARLHILADLKMFGWTEKDPFPRDEKHYVKMGLF
jgi:hypothetical protein